MNYAQADALLQGRCRNQRKLANKTYLHRFDGMLRIKLFETYILTFFPDETFEVDGGKAHTTRDRLKDYLPRTHHLITFGDTWFLRTPVGTTPYTASGRWGPEGCGSLPPEINHEDCIELMGMAHEYAIKYVSQLVAGNLMAFGSTAVPSCEYCGVKDNDPKHIIQHLRRKQYPPELMRWAVRGMRLLTDVTQIAITPGSLKKLRDEAQQAKKDPDIITANTEHLLLTGVRQEPAYRRQLPSLHRKELRRTLEKHVLDLLNIDKYVP